MSTSDLYLLFGKSVRHWSEHRNGWGSAPVIWDYLSDKYIPEKPSYGLSESHLKKVWALRASDGLLQCELAALYFTFDDAYVPVSQLNAVADYFDEIAALTESAPVTAGRVNHWRAFASEFRKISSAVKDRRLRGVCISCTSVSDPWPYKKPTDFGNCWPITGDD